MVSDCLISNKVTSNIKIKWSVLVAISGTDSHNVKIVQNLNRNERRWLCRSQIKGMIHEKIASLKRAQATLNQHQIYPRDSTLDANLNSAAACE